ncbi:hypothetical protein [Aedoeadaptatus coxii]|nr:hypothetical protein [Peptoniphilus coxii]
MEVTIKKGRSTMRVTEKVFRVIYEGQGYRKVDTKPSPPEDKKKADKDDQ